MRILVTGASGFVGSHLAAALQSDHELTGTVFRADRSPARHQVRLDLTAAEEATTLLNSVRPTVVVHCAALSRVIVCEDDQPAASRMNTSSTETIARWCGTHGAKLIYFSSDQVFDGRRGCYECTDLPDPLNHYGRTKLAAEAVVLDASYRNTVIRSNSVVGSSIGFGESFTDSVHRALVRGETVRCFVDQFRSPIHIRRVIALVALCIADDIHGIIHAGGADRLNRAATARLVAVAAGLGPELLHECSYLEHPRHAIMPVDTSYNPTQIRGLLGPIDSPELGELLARDYAPAKADP
ncbi:SDR family oxidoreductase [candidate division KSB1 bacterium]|nr:SDR family oxidoreductase [candidate division KSB1 bacterium]